ncbi:MAG: MarR family transcriptional regulator [Actinomycetota bacterium]|nr:MarR family transcriptional regulator [Actinomycetota bacterium]
MSRALRSEFSDADLSPGLLLWRVTNAWQAAQRAALRPFDLTHVQFVLLASLAWHQGESPVTQRQLAQHAGADPMMTSQVLRTLEAKGLVERRPHPTDARARALIATPPGVDLANRANAAVERADRDYFAVLGEDHPSFTRMLARLTHR